MDLASLIRDIPDFPKPGIIFKDITTLIAHPKGFKEAVDRIAERFKNTGIHSVLAVEARGYIFGGAIAHEMGIGLIIVRKPGKLPYKTKSISYELEYGTDTLCIHEDSIAPGQKILLVDDLLATGGTAKAVCKLIEQMGGQVAACSFVIELDFLKGRENLAGYDVFSLIHF